MASNRSKIKVIQGGKGSEKLITTKTKQNEVSVSQEQAALEVDFEQPNSNLGSQFQQLLYLNFPNPTPVSLVMRRLSQDADWVVIMNPALDREIQIFAKNKLSGDEAEFVLHESLKAVGLRLLKNDKGIYRVAKLRDSESKI